MWNKKINIKRITLNYKNGCLLIFFMFFTILTYGQHDSADVKELTPKIEIIARPLKDSILLRWAPNNSLLWEDANKTGYMVERITILRDGSLLEIPEKKILTSSPLKPLPLEKWEKLVGQNKHAAIAAQALYGETFNIENEGGYNVYTVITKVRERDTRYSFALFSADQSPEVAKYSGLWYTDASAKINEKYLYKVYLTPNLTNADTGYIYTGINEYQPLPKPIDLKAEFSDRKVLLSWNHEYFKHIFTSYILERSDNNKNSFHPVSDEPIVNIIAEEKHDLLLFYKNDSLPENSKTYFYRVRGINSFGEISEPSEIISGEGHSIISYTPYISEKYTPDNKSVVLKWEFPEDKNDEISGFKLSRSSNPKTGYKYIAEKISADRREYTDIEPGINNYYIVSAVNGHGDEVRSAPILMQLIDSIPPSPPVNLKAEIDTTGRVILCWKKNLEDDIYGYRIYRANYAGEEFSQITVFPVADSCYIDNIELKTLTRSIFYKIMAIDLRQNHSDFSKLLEIKRPDILPPVSPVIVNVKLSTEGVYLQWINSTSTDVKNHLLYRSIPKSKEWELIADFPIIDSITSYIDKGADSVDYLYYTLIARDESGLESDPASPVQGKKVDMGIRKGIEKVFYEINREKENIKLVWKHPGGKIYRYIIYRALGENEMTLYTSISGKDDVFFDENVQPNTIYSYSVKTLFVDGSQSLFSEKTIINY